MQKDKKQRRIDFTQEEMAELSQYAQTTFADKMKNIISKYNFKKDAFKRDGSIYNFYPPEYGQIIAILANTYTDNPSNASNSKIKEKSTDDVIAFNKKISEKIEELPSEINEIVENQPWYRTSEKLTDNLDLLVEEMVQIIYNLTQFTDGDISETVIWLCRELDKINYHLYRKHNVSNQQKEGSLRQQEEIFEKIREELRKKTEEERKAIYEECPDLEFIFQMQENAKNECDNPNISIDKGLAEMIKSFMNILNVDGIRDGDVVPENFLSDEDINEYRQGHPECSERELEEYEREEYYKRNAYKWKDAFAHCVKTPGRMSFEVQTGKTWKKIVDRIEEGTFKENAIAEYQGQKMRFSMTDEQFDSIVFKLPEEMIQEVLDEYVAHYNKVKSEQNEMKQIVKRFIGQVLIEYMN